MTSHGSGQAAVSDEERPPHRPGLLLLPLYCLMHSARVLGYAPAALMALTQWPVQTLSSATVYYTLRFKSSAWRAGVRRLIALGSSKRPRLVRAQKRTRLGAEN